MGLSSSLTELLADATAEVALLDRYSVFDLTALGGLLLRSESVASSKIERLNASQRDVARALIGAARPRSTAARVAGNVHAMRVAVERAGGRGIGVATFLAVHQKLMEVDEHHASEAGKLREDQNWIGGSDAAPRGAAFVPPHPRLVRPMLEDLAVFCERRDLNPVVHAAVAHAQFETIHPFVDGNGRTGRALVHLVLRRRGLARQTVVPVSTVLLADPDRYFDALGLYRQGDLDGWVEAFASSARTAAREGRRLAVELERIRDAWLDLVRPRAGSALGSILDALARQPVVDAGTVATICPGTDVSNRYRAIDRLEEAGVLVRLTEGRRNRVWAASEIIELLEDFERRVGRRRRSSLISR